MLLTEPPVRAAHARRDLGAGMRYAVVRLAELLDPDTPLALSACAYCDPLAAVGAFEAAARDYLANPSVRYGTVLGASQLLSDALQQEGNLRRWYPGDLTRLLLFLSQVRRVPAIKTVGERQLNVPYHERTTWVRQRLRALVDGSLARFRSALEDEQAGYRARLLDALSARLAEAPATERAWAELDHDLCYAAALLLGEGRDGRLLARALAAGVAAAPDPAGAVHAMRSVVSRPRSCYQVVTVLAGVRRLGASSAPAFGVELVDRDGPRWTAGGTAAAGRALARFLADQVPAESLPILVNVQAWDPEHARASALAAAEALRDHLVATHPQGRFGVAAETLVHDVAGRRVHSLGRGPAPLHVADPLPAEGAEELLPVLRANALARAERTPVLRILHVWVALEYLAKEGAPAAPDGADGADRRRAAGPGYRPRLESYLPPHLASLAALAGLRSQLLASWEGVRALAVRSERRGDWRQVEAWLGTTGGRPRSLTRLVGLLRSLGDIAGSGHPAAPPPRELPRTASDSVAAAFLLDVADGLGPYARRRLETLGRQLQRGSRLAKAAEAIQVRTLIAIARLKIARHLAVHQGFNAAQASEPLAHSAVLVLSDAFDVLQRWMRPGSRAWDALCEARRWHESNLAAWRAAAELDVDANHLLHPTRE